MEEQPNRRQLKRELKYLKKKIRRLEQQNGRKYKKLRVRFNDYITESMNRPVTLIQNEKKKVPILKTYDWSSEHGYCCQTANGIFWSHNVLTKKERVRRKTQIKPGIVSVEWVNENLHACILPGSSVEPDRNDTRNILDSHGFVILKGALSKDLVKAVKRDANRKYFKKKDSHRPNYRTNDGVQVTRIFNPSGAFRFQANLTSDEKRSSPGQEWTKFKTKVASEHHILHTRLNNAIHRLISPTLHAKQGVILHSQANQKRQYAHRDYNHMCKYISKTNASLSLSSNFGVIVALERGTRFICWPGSHTCTRDSIMHGERKFVRSQDAVCAVLEPGDVLIFMDTLVHCGSDYEKKNTRMHFYCEDVLRALECRKSSVKDCPSFCNRIPMKRPIKCLLRNPNYTDDTIVEVFSDDIHDTAMWASKNGIDGFQASMKKLYDNKLKYEWSFRQHYETQDQTIFDSVSLHAALPSINILSQRRPRKRSDNTEEAVPSSSSGRIMGMGSSYDEYMAMVKKRNELF